ncbi:retrovirus-related pol polyprotein from transposon TNT 1-94, partial [Tanacetum coccineum]
MDTTRAEQIALDDALVAPANRLKIGKSNFRLSSDLKSKEATLQVVYDVLKLTPFYKAFQILVDVPEIYKIFCNFFLQEFFAATAFRDDYMFTTIKVVSRHEDTQLYGAILPNELTNEDIRNSESFKEYYAIASGAEPPKTKASVKKKQIGSDKTTTSSTTKGKRLKTSAKIAKPAKKKQPVKMSMDKGADEGTGSLSGVPDVPTYDSDDEQISWKLSEEDHDDEVNMSEDDDTDNDDVSLNDDDEDDDNADNQDDDNQDDDNQDDKYDGHDDQDADATYDQDKDDLDAENQDDDNDQTHSDNNGDDFVHPKFSTYDEEKREEESFDPRVQTPSHVESTGDEEVQGTNIKDEEMDEEATHEEDEANELYRDVNANLEGRDTVMTDAPLPNVLGTQITEDTYVIITAPVIPEGQQRSSSVSSGFVSNMLNPRPDTCIDSIFTLNTEATSLVDVPVTTTAEPPLVSATTLPPPPTPLITHMQQTPVPTPTTVPSSSLQDLPNFGSLFGFDHRLKTLETDFSEFKQTNQFAEAVSSIPGIVDAYLANKMHEAVKTAVQLQSERLRDEAQAENADFLNKLDDNIKKIIKDQVKEQVKAQVSKILPKIKKTVNEQLEAEVMTHERIKSKRTLPTDQTGGSKRRRAGKEPELTSTPKEKTPKSTGKSTEGRQVILFDHFINNDLAYLSGGVSSRTYATSVTKTKAADYNHIKWIEDLVPNTMWSEVPESARDVYSKRRIIAVTKLQIVEWHGYKHLDWITVRRDDDKLYTFKEGDFKWLRLQDIKDMLILLASSSLRRRLEDMEFESTNSNTTAKLPILKLGEYEIWVIRIKQYFQIQDYALWEVIENGNSWVSVHNSAQARSLLLMALPNEHQLTFSQYPDAKTMFAAIETRFGGNEATKKTQKTLLKQQYENFSASSAESLDSIFNRLQKIVSRLAILGVVIAQEDLNSKFLSSLPPEWNTHVVVWMNKPEIETMSIDDLYNNFKIVEQKIVLEAMDLKWKLSLLSMRAKRYYQRTGKNFFINANDTAGYDKSKVECFNCHKMGNFSRECRAPRSKKGQFRNQDNTRKQGNNEDISSKAMLAIDGVGFDWSDMAEEQVQTNMALMAFSDSEVYNEKTCSKTCLKNYETRKKQCDDLIVKLNQIEFTTATYKRGLTIVKEQIITYRKNEVLFSEEVAVLKREVACKDYKINMLKINTAKAQAVNTGRHKAVNTARPNSAVVNAIRVNQANGKPQQDDTGFVDNGCSRHMTGNIAYLLYFKEFDGGYVTFGGGAHGGRISGKGTLKTD